jgi:hypothetical protein
VTSSIDCADCLGERRVGLNLNEKVNVIVGPADDVGENSFVLANSGDESPEARLKFFGDSFLAIFRAEDDVENILGVRVRHVPHLRC